MKILYISLLFLMNCVLSVAQPEIIIPKPHQLKWHEAEMGAVFHYDLHVFDGIRYGQGNNRISPIEDYNIFNPTQLNTDQWVSAAKAAGCKFAVLTATHETGFGLWQSDVNPYCLKAVKWRNGKGDIVRDFVNSCRKYGIQPGIYVGIRWNSLLGIHNFKVAGDGEFAANRQAWYKRFCEKMVEELCTRYGDLYMIWFDGGADDPRGDGPDVEPIVNKYQPNCLFYHNIDRADFRWGGSETGTVGYPCWSTFPAPCSHHKRIESQKDQIALLKQESDERAAVGVILQAQDSRGDVHLVALEVDDAVLLPVAAAMMADGDAAVAVAAGMLLLRLDQAAFGLGLLVDPLEGGHSHVTAGGGSGLKRLNSHFSYPPYTMPSNSSMVLESSASCT